MTSAGPGDAGSGLGERFEVVVGAVAHGGHCVAHAPDGRVVFVRHALPGETVTVEVTEEHPGYLRADAHEVRVASPHRVPPPCRYAGRCGGCDFQHATAAYQRELKTAVVAEQLRRVGGLTAAQVDALDPAVQPLPGGMLGWRTRVGFAVDATGRAGLLAHRSHQVVAVHQCLIAHPAIQELELTRRQWPGADRLEAVAGADGRVSVHEVSRDRRRLVAGADRVGQRAAGRDWQLPPDAFWQVHPGAAERLAQAVEQLLSPRSGDVVWDLYGGAGLFTAVMAAAVGPAGSVTLVDSDPSAVAAGRANLADLSNVHLICSTVERAWLAGRPDLVILDPPRAGVPAAVLRRVVRAGPRALAYVACDPASFARDVSRLRADGWRLTTLRTYDAFPMTHHVECVGLFHRDPDRRGPGPIPGGHGPDTVRGHEYPPGQP